MPYSKDPAKYPLVLQELPALLNRTTAEEIRIPAQDRREANSRRVQIQAYFSALGHKAREMRAIAEKERDKRLKAAQLASNSRDAARASAAREEAIKITQDDIKDAEGLAKTWEDRASTVAEWMVRTIEVDGVFCVEISKRSLGSFGDAMLEVFGVPQHIRESITHPKSAIPPKPALVTEGITAPVETSVEAMLAKARKELQEKIDSGELPQKGA